MSDHLYIGIISGTSMDGLDAALVEIMDDQIRTIEHHSRDITPSLKETLRLLCTPGDNEIQRSGEADVALGQEIATTINELLVKQNLNAADIEAIGSHGQTIRHSVDTDHPFTLQIGNPNVIAEQTGITTIADFRMADIAAGGQGAPLACTLHDAVFRSDTETRVIVNLGGIANITLLKDNESPLGFDTGTANTLLDQWILQKKNVAYDRNGEWARSGEIIPDLLVTLLQDPYIKLSPPKSTGREYFNLEWLWPKIENKHYTDEDIQRTLLEYSVETIANAIKETTPDAALYFCGGGVFNTFLMERLKAELSDYSMHLTDELGIHTQQVEATAFAYLAYRTQTRLAGNLPTVTGANKPKVLGGIYLAS